MAQYVPTDGFSEISIKFSNEFEADRKRFDENAAKLKSDFEASDMKLKAGIESLFKTDREASTNPNSDEKWLLARKAWAWMNRKT